MASRLNMICGMIGKLYNSYKRVFKNKFYCYYIYGGGRQFQILYPIGTATSLCQLSHFVCDKSFIDNANHRFLLGHILYYCHDKKTIIGYGWKIPNVKKNYAWEIASMIHFKNPVDILYDFYVNPNYRRRGIYKSLLNFIVNCSTNKSKIIIYAEITNYPSNKAIKECGFNYFKKISFLSSHLSLFL